MTIQSKLQEYNSHIQTHVYEKTIPFLGANEAYNLSRYGKIYVRSKSGSIYQINLAARLYYIASVSDNVESPISIHGGPKYYDRLYTVYNYCIGPVGTITDRWSHTDISKINLAIIQVITFYLMIRADERYFVHVSNYESGMVVSLRGFLDGHGVIE